MAESRFFAHSFSDELRDVPLDLFRSAIVKIVDKLMHDESRGHSIYTGISGVSYGLFRLLTTDKIPFPLQTESVTLTRQEVWDRVLRNVRYSMETMRERPEKRHGWSVFCGHAGIYCSSAIILQKASYVTEFRLEVPQRLKEESRRALKKFTNLSVLVKSFSAAHVGLPEDEILYGRAGYLLGILLVQRYGLIEDPHCLDIISSTLDSGRYQSYQFQHPCPLHYQWPAGEGARPYVGAAHGLIGILYTLLHFVDEIRSLDALPLVRDSLHFVLSLECDHNGFKGLHGFYPTTTELTIHSYLVHWCHGSTGAVFLFSKAHEVFQEEVFLNAAIRAGDVVWQRGLLKKGPGLCHGVSGNGYALLKLYKITNDEKYLIRASCFAEFMISAVFQTARVPDNPWSLFEGWAGALCFLLDMLDPKNSQFPFFEF